MTDRVDSRVLLKGRTKNDFLLDFSKIGLNVLNLGGPKCRKVKLLHLKVKMFSCGGKE